MLWLQISERMSFARPVTFLNVFYCLALAQVKSHAWHPTSDFCARMGGKISFAAKLPRGDYFYGTALFLVDIDFCLQPQ